METDFDPLPVPSGDDNVDYFDPVQECVLPSRTRLRSGEPVRPASLGTSGATSPLESPRRYRSERALPGQFFG